MEHKTLKAAATVTDEGIFTALAATYSRDRGGDEIVPGAFERTIKAWQETGRNLPLHWDHESSAESIIGFIAPGRMRETEEGLYVEGQLDLEKSEIAREAWRSMKANALALSFGYLTVKSRSEGKTTKLLELDLFEVSIVPAPMNNDTRILSLKSQAFQRGGIVKSAEQKPEVRIETAEDNAAQRQMDAIHNAQLLAVKSALENKAIVRDSDLCSIEEPWAVMDGDEVVSCHANQEDAREGMEKRMSSIAEAAARTVQPEPEPADEKTLRKRTFDMALESANGGPLPRKTADSPETLVLVPEDRIREVVKDELAQVVEKAKTPPVTVNIERAPTTKLEDIAVEDESDEEPTVKSASQDPLRKRTEELALEVANGGMRVRKRKEPEPVPEPEPLSEAELRRRHDRLALEIARG